jgi:hypothetical protein
MRSPSPGQRTVSVELDDDEPSYGRSDAFIVQVARNRLAKVVEDYSGPGTNKLALAAVAISGLFADLVSTLSSKPDIIAVINQQLASAGLEVVEKRRN